MKSLKFLLLLTSLILFSCDNSQEHKHSEDDGQQHETHTVDNHQHEAEEIDNSVLHLNQGIKWTVNDATHVGMSAILQLLKNYSNEGGTDYASLGSAMSTEASTLINKCDMVGIDHDQLHLILHPILESIDAIKEGGSSESIEALGSQLSTYFDHFQTK